MITRNRMLSEYTMWPIRIRYGPRIGNDELHPSEPQAFEVLHIEAKSSMVTLAPDLLKFPWCVTP